MTTPNLREVCRSCGEPWATHLGIFGTCAKLQVALNALQEIVDVSVGGMSVNPSAHENMLRLCIAVQALKEIER